MIKLELIQDGKAKTYTVPFVSTRALRGAVELAGRINADSVEAGTLDDLVAWVVELFGYRFSADDVLDGLPADKFFSVIMETLSGVMKVANEKLNKFPNLTRGK